MWQNNSVGKQAIHMCDVYKYGLGLIVVRNVCGGGG